MADDSPSQDEEESVPPHTHIVKSYQKDGVDRVGFCWCLEEVTRQYNYYDS